MFSKRSKSSKSTDSQSPEAGWYPDPNDATLLRLWDGSQWTDKLIYADANHESGASKETKKLAKSVSISHRRETARLITQQQVEQLNSELDQMLTQALACAQSGDIKGEERHLASFLATAAKGGGSAGRQNAERRIQELTSEKKLRIGSELIGTVKREHGLAQYSRTEKLSQVRTGGKSATIYSDRIFHGDTVYVIDSSTGAQVTLDGVAQITQRPTLTRMALLSPLPGTALIPGLALQKKKTNDMRSASFIVASSQWSFTIPISPDEITKPREIAERINRIAANLERLETPQQHTLVTHTPPTPTPPTQPSVIQELKELQGLIESGVITPEEAQVLKNKIIGTTSEGN